MKAALFVDLNDLYYCVGKKYPGSRVDYEAYLQHASTFGEILRAFAYGFQCDVEEEVHFITFLRKIGYETHYKRPRTIKQDAKRMDWGVGIAVDIFRVIDKVDCVIIGSSDPELAPLVQWIHDRGVQSVIFSAVISKELRDVADRFYEIEPVLLCKNDPDVSS